MKKSKKISKTILFRAAELLVILILLIQYGTLRPNKLLASGKACRGADLSHYQGQVDMEKLAQQGIEFLYVKATDGGGYIDEQYDVNCRNAENAGLLVGAYHFFTFDCDGREQAEHFIQKIGNQNGNLIPAVDVEYYGNLRKHPPGVQEVKESLQACLDALEEEYHYKPVLYTTLPFYYKYIRKQFKEYPLWIRNVHFPATLSVGRKWSFWQYDDKTVLDGYDGEERYIDLNVFHGDRKRLEESMVIKKNYTYAFERCSRKNLQNNNLGFCNLYTGAYDTADKHSLFIGQVIARFGEPEYRTGDNEDLFSQTVAAEDRAGNILYLEVYYGPSGPAITGMSRISKKAGKTYPEEEYQKAIDELAEYIMEAKPADFAWESNYGDMSVNLKMGVKDGVPYYETIFPEELEKAFMENE